MRILLWIAARLKALVRPLAPVRFCAACGKEIGPGELIVFEGQSFDSYFCVPSVRRVTRVEQKREADWREAERFKLSKGAGL